MVEKWRYACPHCGSVDLVTRTRKGGYRCNRCRETFPASERIDKKAESGEATV